jgi:hypothetical protein
MAASLENRKAVSIGRRPGIARATAIAARAAGTRTTVGGRNADALGEEGNAEHFEHFRTRNRTRRIETVDDIAEAVTCAMTDKFMTGMTCPVDRDEPVT